MKIPYGRSNFGEIRREGFFYADKTPFLQVLERSESGYAYVLFLRPRRFGKSLFVSLLEHYYDLAKADEFDTLFGGLWIHENPTPKRNQYLILSLDFSQVATDGDQGMLRRSFFQSVRSRIQAFLLRYRDRIAALADLEARLDRIKDEEALVGELFDTVAATGHKLYVLIDEYDNFANRLLAGGEQEVYEAIATRTGFVRSFYATLKTGTASGAIGRMFITGVSPLLLDDLSSGFNIASQTSQNHRLHSLAGFNRADLERALDEFLAARPQIAALPELGDRGRLLAVLEQYYNGYRFSPDSAERVFNSDMVLYFLSELDRAGRYPIDMLDLNVRTDYQRLQRIGVLSGAAAADRRALLETIASDGGIQSRLIRQFGVRSLSSQDQFISLLYYLGMLTLGPQPADMPEAAFGYRLEIPNRVIRELQWEHLVALLQDQAQLDLDTRDLDVPLQAMALRGDIGPFLDLFHERVVKAIGVKDLRRFDEKSLKLMLLAFLSLSRLFYPLSEKEFAQGYCDLFLGISPLYPAAKFAWLLELKYLPTGARAAQIEKAFAQAAEQVARYASDERLVPLLTQGQALKAGMLVFVGAQKVMFRPWPVTGRGAAAGTHTAPRPPKREPAAKASKKAAPARRPAPKRGGRRPA